LGAFDANTHTLTLQNANGVIAMLSVDNGGYLNIGADGVDTVPVLNAWSFLTFKMKDSGEIFGTLKHRQNPYSRRP